MRIILGVLALLLLLFPASASAEISVSNLVIDFQADGPRAADIEVTNRGKQRAYVTVDPREVLNPGTKKEERVRERDPSKLGLLVTPQRMILEAGERRVVRIVKLASNLQSDRVYRIEIKPVVGKLNAVERSGVKVLVGYDALVIVRPDEPKVDYDATRSERAIFFKNRGNTNLFLAGRQQCDGKECQKAPGRRLYAGASLTIDLPYDTPVEYSIGDGRNHELKRFVPPSKMMSPAGDSP